MFLRYSTAFLLEATTLIPSPSRVLYLPAPYDAIPPSATFYCAHYPTHYSSTEIYVSRSSDRSRVNEQLRDSVSRVGIPHTARALVNQREINKGKEEKERCRCGAERTDKNRDESTGQRRVIYSASGAQRMLDARRGKCRPHLCRPTHAAMSFHRAQTLIVSVNAKLYRRR